MTNDDKRATTITTVAQFAQQYIESLLWQSGQMAPGADQNEPLRTALMALHQDPGEGLRHTMEGQEWLTMALYGAGILEEDAGYIREICQGLAEWMFARPGGFYSYDIPARWADTPMGQLWWLAVLRTEGDELITLTQAAEIAGVTVQAISQRIVRGSLRAFTDPFAPERQGRQKVRRSEVAKRRN